MISASNRLRLRLRLFCSAEASAKFVWLQRLKATIAGWRRRVSWLAALFLTSALTELLYRWQ